MLSKKINYLHAPKIGREVERTLRSEKVAEQRRSVRTVGDGSQKLGRRLRNAVVAQQRVAEHRGRPSRTRDLFIPCGAQRVNYFLNKLRIIRWIHRKRIAHLKPQSPSRQ